MFNREGRSWPECEFAGEGWKLFHPLRLCCVVVHNENTRFARVLSRGELSGSEAVVYVLMLSFSYTRTLFKDISKEYSIFVLTGQWESLWKQ